MSHEFTLPSDGLFEAQRTVVPPEAARYMQDVDEITPEDYDDAETAQNTAGAGDTTGGEISDDTGSEDDAPRAAQPDEFGITPAEPDRAVDDVPPPPPNTPPTPEQPADAPRPFGVRHFSTDPKYELEPPVPAIALEMKTGAAVLKYERFIDVQQFSEDDVMASVELEHVTPEGKVAFEVSLGVLTAVFTDNEGNTDYHVYHIDDTDVVRRYDLDINAHLSLAGSEEETQSEPLYTDDVLENAQMDMEMGSGSRVVGGSEMDYIAEHLEKAEPLIVPFTKLDDAIVEREARQLRGDGISWEEKALACKVVEQAVQGTLDDPDSGYERYDEGYKFGGKMTIREPNGNFTEVDIGMSRAGNNGEELNPYIIIRHTEASLDRMPEGAHYRGPLTKDRTIKYEARSYRSDPHDSRFGSGGNTNFTQSPNGPRVQYTLVPYASAGIKEALLLRNFIRKPRRR